MEDVQFQKRPTLIDIRDLRFWNPRGFGYFARPIEREDLKHCTPSDARDWVRLESLISRLKKGEFSAGSPLLELSRTSNNVAIKRIAISVVGHAGTAECFRDMRTELEPQQKQPIDEDLRSLTVQYCRAFASWGRLDVVPVLAYHYLRLRLERKEEISALPLCIGDLLVDDRPNDADEVARMIPLEPPEDMLDDYLSMVMNRYEHIANKHGSDKVFIFQGQLLSVRQLAKDIRNTSVPYRYAGARLSTLRERFEPATGIDCSAFFEGPEGHATQPLTASAIAEQFLDSPKAASFEENKRYFFGHPIPAG